MTSSDATDDEFGSELRFVRAGTVVVPDRPERLAAVVASGVVVTAFEATQRRGGLAHFARPLRDGQGSSPWFAAPAIVGLSRLLAMANDPSRFEIQLFGAADDPNVDGYEPALASENIRVTRELLGRLGLRIASEDFGGLRGRKLVFDTATGECVVARVDQVRTTDWYPKQPGDVR